MTYSIKKREYGRSRPQWLKNVLFCDFSPSLLSPCDSVESARKHLSEISTGIMSSSYLKAHTGFELKEDTFTVLSKSRYPIVDFQIVRQP